MGERHLLACLALALTPGLGPRRAGSLRATFGDPEALLAAGPRDLARAPGIGPDLAARLYATLREERAARELERAHAAGVELVAVGGDGYPALLAAIYDPPTVLYLRGRLPTGLVGLAGNVGVALVGTRSASRWASAFARAEARALAGAGAVIVSGLAIGIDAAAHEGALDAAGATVAVLAGGVDRPSPAVNAALAERLLAAGGALVSEYPLGTRPERAYFPGRNRIISGLCRAVVIVEAPHGSGALHTAAFALEQGRAVLAVPGRPTDAGSAGSNALLADGAAIYLGPEDLAAEVPLLGHASLRPTSPPAPAAAAAPADLSPTERALLEQVWLEQPLGGALLDELAARANGSLTELLAALTKLELRGLVRMSASGRYQLVR